MNKDFLLISLGRVFQIVVSLVAVRVFTTFLSTAEVGNLYLINSIVGFYGLALINPIHMYIYRKIYDWAEKKALINCFFVFNGYVLLLTVISLPLTYLLNKTGMLNSVDLAHLMMFLVFYIYFVTWNQTILSVLNMFSHRASFVVFTILTLSLGLAFSVVMTRLVSGSALGWLTGQLVAQGLIAGAALLYFKRVFADTLSLDKIRPLINRESLNSVMVFAFPLFLTNFFMWLQNQSYRMIVEKNFGLEFLGMLGLGLSISSSVATAVESIVQQLYYPVYYREISTYNAEQRTHAWNKMAQMILPIYATLTIMVSCLAPFLMNILANRKFSEAFVFIIYGAWIELFRMTSNLLASVAHAEMQTKFLVKAYFAGGLLAVSGTYFASKWQDYHQIIPAVLMASGFFTLAVMYVQMKKLARFKVGIRQIRKAALLSTPFALAIPFYGYSRDLIVSLLITSIMGAYFTLTVYRSSGVFKKTVG